MTTENDSLSTANFRFHGELNDFLPAGYRMRDLTYAFTRRASVKDMVEAQGVPHTEVAVITVNGESIGFDYHVKDGDYIAVYPTFENLDVDSIVYLREKLSATPRFILDVHLGKLARYMRLMGFDTFYCNDYDDDRIAQLSVEQHRAVLTRDRKMLHRRIITHGYWLRSQNAHEQLSEVIRRFELKNCSIPFSRCPVCNEKLEAVKKADVFNLLEPKTKLFYTVFHRCAGCGKIYWQGSHFSKIAGIVGRYTAG